MSSQTQPASLPAPATFVERHHFLLRRLQSLTGVVPVGVFLIEHMLTNAAVLHGGEEYQKDVTFIWNLPSLLMLEIFGIWLPIAFHGGLGMVYVFTGRPNSIAYPYSDNRRYTWMRVTGVIALVYIFLHIATTRWGWDLFGWHTPFSFTDATRTTAAAVQFAWPWVFIFYVVGTLATIYHFANGMWTFALTWGLTVSVAAQRRWGYVCAAMGIVLAGLAMASLWVFSTLPTT